MKKIRVHDLAKEVKLESKDLLTLLQQEGYGVKTHSSNLEASVAQAIRSKLGLARTEVQGKKNQEQSRAVTVIRRRKKVEAIEPEEGSAQLEASQDQAAPEHSETAALVEKVAEQAVGTVAGGAEQQQALAASLAPDRARSSVAVTEAPAFSEAPKAPALAPRSPVSPKPSTSPRPVKLKAPPAHPKDPGGLEGSREPEARAKPLVPQERKGLARVIKKAAIVVTPSTGPRPPKSRKVEKAKKTAVSSSSGVGVEAEKKKNKRFVKFSPDPEREAAKKGIIGKRKRKGEVLAEDFEELGLVPVGIRLGRSSRGGGGQRKQSSKPQHIAETKAIKKRITVHETISVGDLAHRMGAKANELIAKLMGLGVMATLNQVMDVDTATLVAGEFGYEVELGKTEEQGVLSLDQEEGGGKPKPRPPVVTVMGHVDHGKTSILDAIRKTDVVSGESGGITQHIGAYHVRAPQGEVVFLDTPGHEAFTEMRSRGAQITDVVVLVVAADDGVMDQTREAINHARAAKVPILVCINKIDKAEADPSRVKRELAELGLMSEEWGGDTIFCETSAKKGIGIAELLDSILLQAEILELRADPARRGKGHVIEAQLHKGRGPVATVLVQQGTLRVGDALIAGQYFGKVRSLFNDKGEHVQEAYPSMPVEIHGLSGVPQAGDEFIVVRSEKMARSVSAERQLKVREKDLAAGSKISLENLFSKLQEGEVKELLVVLRADVQGTLEAFASSLAQLSTDNVRVRILNSGTGTVTESDVLLAAASDALVIGFNVRPGSRIQDLAKKEKVDMRFYDVIYHALEDIKKAMEGMLEPKFVEETIGSAEVRQTFQVSKVGTIAGCYVAEGKAERNSKVRLLRDGVVVYSGQLSSLKRFKEDAKEVQSGYECGISLHNFNDIKDGDVLEFFVKKEIKPVL